MFPIPVLMLTGGSPLPLPPGMVKSVVTTWYVAEGYKQSVAVLLKNGDLYTQGDNFHGELGDGSLTANNNTWFKSQTDVKRVFGTSYTFVIEKNDGTWHFVGYLVGLVGSGADVPNWTPLPTSITDNLDMTTIKDVHGGPGATMWLLNDGRMFATGTNASGCVGKGSLTASYSVPTLVQNAVKRVVVTEAKTVYLNSETGLAYVAGLPGNTLGNGSSDTVPNFRLVATPTGFFAEEMISFGTVTLFIGHMSEDPSTKYIYSIGVTDNVSYKREVTKFGDGFSSFQVPTGYFANLFWAEGKFYGMGTGPQGTPDGDFNPAPVEPTPPYRGESWDISKINQVTLAPIAGALSAPNGGHFMIYDGNLFFTGVSNINQSKYNSAKFKNISEFNT